MQLQQPKNLNSSCLEVMNFLNEVTLWYPSAISFAPGRPAEQLLDVRQGLDKFSSYAAHAAKNSNQPPSMAFNQLGQYQKTNGIINDLVCQFLERDEGIHTTAGAIMITDGCQEAMTILLAGLFNPGDDVLIVMDPAYTGITGIASVLGTELYSLFSEEGDIDLEV